MTFREAISVGEKVLSLANIEDAKNDAWLLLAMVCKINRTYYYVHMDEELTIEQTKEYENVLKKRAEHIHIQRFSKASRSGKQRNHGTLVQKVTDHQRLVNIVILGRSKAII